MSGFTLHEYSIAVDVFNVESDVYLLTHCHTDHLVGLNQSFNGRIYCTELTKRLLLLNEKYNRFMSNFHQVSLDVTFSVSVGGTTVYITPIDSYHCPGSCMFLIEGQDSNVLVTGDIRAEKWWTQYLVKHPKLFPYATGCKVLDNIYLDTTFGYRGEPFIEMLPNSEGIASVIKLLQLYPEDPDVSITFPDHVLGFEEAWTQILALLNCSVHVCSQVDSRNNVLPTHLQVKSNNKQGLNLHICGHGCDKDSEFNVTVRQCINFNIVDYISCLLPIDVKTVKDLEVIRTTSHGYDIIKHKERLWIKKDGLLLPQDIKLVFSRHSSYSECKQFIKLFRPVQVYPCGSSDSLWKTGFVMSRLFGDVCQLPNPSNFLYDVWMSVKMKFPHDEIMQRKVITINRWDINQCENEFQFVSKVLNKGLNPQKDFQFFGIPLSSEIDVQSSPNSNENVQLSKLICSQNDTKITTLIKKSEYLYRQYIIHGLPGQRPSNRDYLQEINELEQQLVQDSYETTQEESREEMSSSCSSIRNFFEGSKAVRTSLNGTSATPNAFSARRASVSSGATVVDEFGAGTITTKVAANQCTIPSSFNSFECSLDKYHHIYSDTFPDPATIRRITSQLKKNPDIYFNFNLKSLNQFSLH